MRIWIQEQGKHDFQPFEKAFVHSMFYVLFMYFHVKIQQPFCDGRVWSTTIHIRILIEVKIWIRIRIENERIHNTDCTPKIKGVCFTVK